MAVSMRIRNLEGVGAHSEALPGGTRRQLPTAKRRIAQDRQLVHHSWGHVGSELRAFLTEVWQDILQFPNDVGLDLHDPQRRVESDPHPPHLPE